MWFFWGLCLGGEDENVGLMRRKLCYQCKITHKCGRLFDEKAFAQKIRKTEIFWNMILRGFIILHRRVVQVYFADWIIGALIFCTTCCGVMDGTMVGYFQGGCCLVLGLEEELALAQPPLFAPVGVELLFHLPDAQCTQHTGRVTQNIYTMCRDNLSIYRTQYAICIVCSHTIQIQYKCIPCV